MTDITAILTAHSETVLAGPSMQSADAAIAAAEAAGFTVERLIGLDNATDACRAFFEQDAFAAWRRVEMAFKDQGKARNALAREAAGRWIAFLDADDLWSENWLAEAARHLAEAGEAKVIVHPELNWIFEKQASILAKTPQDDPLMLPHYLYFANYYDALAMAPRAAHVDHPYADRDLGAGFALEDLQWNIETMAAGWRHVVATDTIIFKRRREMSQNIRASQRAAVIRDLEVMRIDRVAALGEGGIAP